jgi:hypothetical protein
MQQTLRHLLFHVQPLLVLLVPAALLAALLPLQHLLLDVSLLWPHVKGGSPAPLLLLAAAA